MSEDQLRALLANLRSDEGLQEKLKVASNIDAALAIVKQAGFDVSKGDWLAYQAKHTLELSEQELEGVVGGACGLYGTTGAPANCTDTGDCCVKPSELCDMTNSGCY